jgi:hypothetical protein
MSKVIIVKFIKDGLDFSVGYEGSIGQLAKDLKNEHDLIRELLKIDRTAKNLTTHDFAENFMMSVVSGKLKPYWGFEHHKRTYTYYVQLTYTGIGLDIKAKVIITPTDKVVFEGDLRSLLKQMQD